MDAFYRIVALLGGLALFLYGMRIMGDGLKSSSGGAMKTVLAKVTNKPVMGFIFGMLVTCMIQSSTATIVLTVGLVGAGFLTFQQSVGIVLGANVGTAITAQIIRLMDVQAGAGSILYFFKSDNLAPLALTIGIILIMFVKGTGANTAGTIFMGFGILFVGLMNMSAAVADFSDELTGFLVSMEGNDILGFLAGVLVTGVIQSSSAVVGMLQSVASTVGIRFCGLYSIIVGINIGDCITTYLVSRIGANADQVRTCLVHIIYNIIAATLIFVSLFILRTTGILNDNIWYMVLGAGGVANVHGLFRLVPAVLILPFSGTIANLARKIVKDDEIDEEDALIEKNLRELDMRLITNPGLAMTETAHLLGHMADTALHNFDACAQQINEYDTARNVRIGERENLLDRMADSSNRYLLALSPYIKLDSDKRRQNYQLKTLVCYERIGDLAEDIAQEIRNIKENGQSLSEGAMKELLTGVSAVREILATTIEADKNLDIEMARKVEPFEEVIDELIEELRTRHIARMTHQLCDPYNAIQFQNIMVHLERISDQCSDLAVYLIGVKDDSVNGREHEYIHQLHHSNNARYLTQFNQYYQKYVDPLKDIPEEGTEIAASVMTEEEKQSITT